MLKAVANIGTAIRALEDYNKNKIKNMKGLSAYHVQQAVELIIKYLIYTNAFYNGNELYTHDISKLIMIAEGLNIGSLDATSDTKNFENRIGLVSRYLEAIERNTGNDMTADWASDNGHWYNEASAIYLRQDLTSINVGFEKVKRTLINGLKVPSDNRTDMGTKAYSFGWVLDVPDKKAIADFRGTTIKFSNPAMLLFSKTVYATNMSVQDNI